MIRNNLTLIQTFTILMLGISLSLLFVAWIFHGEMNSDGVVPDTVVLSKEVTLYRNIYLSLGLLFMIPALGLLARQKWAATVLMVIFWLFGIGWTILLIILLSNRTFVNDWEAIAILVGLATLVYACIAAGILYLDNVYVMESLGDKKRAEDVLLDVLDQ
jgi:hypothetical protein